MGGTVWQVGWLEWKRPEAATGSIQCVVGRGYCGQDVPRTLRCGVAFDDIQRNVVVELLLHSCCV